MLWCLAFVWIFFFQAEDGIRDLVRSRGLGDVYKRQDSHRAIRARAGRNPRLADGGEFFERRAVTAECALSLIHI